MCYFKYALCLVITLSQVFFETQNMFIYQKQMFSEKALRGDLADHVSVLVNSICKDFNFFMFRKTIYSRMKCIN